MKTIWEKFEHWLSENWTEGWQDLNPPASDEEIAALEVALGTPLPADFVECLYVATTPEFNKNSPLLIAILR